VQHTFIEQWRRPHCDCNRAPKWGVECRLNRNKATLETAKFGESILIVVIPEGHMCVDLFESIPRPTICEQLRVNGLFSIGAVNGGGLQQQQGRR
jgi:hypothetical protein